MLLKEHTEHNDLIQGNFIDSYNNLSYKSLLAWEWITKNCLNARYILKIDDDVVPNTFYLLKFLNRKTNFGFSLSSLENLKHTFICKIVTGGRVCREKKRCGKSYVPKDQYNKKEFGMTNKYSRYCHGAAILMTPDLVSSLLIKASQVKFFFIDDVYVGILGRYTRANFIQLWNKYIDKKKLAKNSDALFVMDVSSINDIYRVWNTFIKNSVIMNYS